jgi:TonB-dependent SusC/RagA subfamily outer membrane receptor
MPALFLFLFKVNMALVLFCIGYYTVLRQLTFYSLNRVYLITAIIFSTIYPGINLSGFVQRHQQLTEPVQTVMLNWETPAKNLVKPLYQPDYWQWVEVIFWAGVVLFAVRMSVQLFSLIRLYRRSKPGQIDEHRVRLLTDDIGPFSFWRSVYINPTKLSPAELKNVLQHEQIHVNQWHTIDLLLAELSTVFYWFNPGVWLMKKAVRENLEFITDRKILQKGADSKEYQYSLVSVSLATMPNTIVNHFNISTIKKRIIMMNAKRSSGYNLTRYLFLVPAVVILLLTFSLSKAEVATHTIKSIASALSNVSIVNVGNTPKTTDNIKSKKSTDIAVNTRKTDTIYSGKSKNGKKSFLVISGQNSDSVTYVINGTKATKAQAKALDPEKVMSVETMPASRAKEYLPDLDNDRQVLFITTEDSEAGKKLKEKMDKAMQSDVVMFKAKNMAVSSGDKSSDDVAATLSGSGMAYSTSTWSNNSADVVSADDNKAISYVTITGDTGKLAKTKTFKRIYITGSPKEVVTVRGLNGDTSTERREKIYVMADAKPVVYVSKRNNDELTIDGNGQPLFMIDGKEVKSLKNISPADIKSITILKDGTAEKKYGEKGKNGVVEITTKKGK